MTPEQFEQLQHSINTQLRDGIELHVNGKIRSLTAKFENYVEDDMKWKQDVTPYIESMKQLKGFSVVGTSVLKAILLIGSAVGAIYAFIKYLRN